jgi:CheY-like chemotaxis protein
MIESSLKEARILIVDDRVANVALLSNILARIGYSAIRSTTDSRETLDLVTNFKPDLIILDLMMPFLNGFEVIQQLEAVNSRETFLPILVLTADVASATKSKALAVGATDLLHKPFDASEIFMRIRNLLQTRFLHLQIQNQYRLLEDKVTERTGELAAALDELKKTQSQMVQQERLRAFGEMAVIGYSELLLQDPTILDDKPTVLDYLKTMNTAGRDAAHVVSRLRDFYRPREDADNAAALREALTNLVFNAVDAMPEDGPITFRARREGDRVILETSDSGTGLPERSLRVPVVDDEPMPRAVVTKYLLADGHDVVTVASGAEAASEMEDTNFDLLLTDHLMPDMNGLELAHLIKTRNAAQRIILLTGYRDPALAPGEKPAGIDALLCKPIPQRELRNAIAQLTEA